MKPRTAVRRMALLTPVLLLIELLDEFVFGAREAALPLIRDELNLSYQQVGLLLTLPIVIASVIEPLIFMLADVWKRKWLVLGGALFYGTELLILAITHDFLLLLLAMIVLFPASGALVGLAQAALMDSDPQRHEQQMARWTLAGSVGVVAGPLALGAALAWAGWRELFAVLGGVTFVVTFLILPHTFPRHITDETPTNFRASIRGAGRALRQKAVLRWLVLLQFSDLMLDVLLSFMALYLVDVAGVTPAQAAAGVAVWTGVGLLGDVLLIPILERVKGLTYLRVSTTFELVLFPAFLIAPGYVPKLMVLGLLGLSNAGSYAILQGQLYAALPGRSGAALALGSFAGLMGSTMPLVIGLAADAFGLEVAIWLLLAGPIALLIGLYPRGADSFVEGALAAD